MPWPCDHPARIDPNLRRWADGLDEIMPGARCELLLRYLPGRRVATRMEYEHESVVVKVFASPRARGNARRLRAFADRGIGALVPAVLGCDTTGHVLAVGYRHGIQPAGVPDADYADCFFRVGSALRELHDSGAELDRLWPWEEEVRQLRRRAVPATTDLIEDIVHTTRRLATLELVPAHRDCHPGQVVVAADGSVTWIDLDDAAMAPRGLDIGNMLAHLALERVTGSRSAVTTTQAGVALIEGYGPCAHLTEDVLTGWTRLALARLAGLAESRHGDIGQRDALLGSVDSDLALDRSA